MRIIKLVYINNRKFYIIGAIFVILNYLRHGIFGYKTPRTFSINQIDRSIDYDFSVVNNWVNYFKKYTSEENSLRNKVVLEIGPGPDLGTGLILLAMGVKKYIALDVNKLIGNHIEFYEKLLEKINERYSGCNVEYLKEQVDKCIQGKGEMINYIVDKHFEISKIKENIDIIFSHAAFEHLTNVGKTFMDLNNVVSGGILISLIDFRTHTSWIRDKDPLNIYRYSDFFWNVFKFKGSPNKIRAYEYKELLEKNGWHNIQIEPLVVLNDEYLEKVKPSLNKKFKNLDSSEMRMLGIMLMATKK